MSTNQRKQITRTHNVSRTRARVAPKFQSVAIVLAGLQHRARAGDVDRHRKLLFHCMGHLVVASEGLVTAVYQQAVSMAWGARSLDGLESIVLLGMQSAFAAGDRRGAELGLSTLARFPLGKSHQERPIVFLDRSSSMLTLLTPEEYGEARTAILRTPKAARLAWGIGGTIRAFDAPVPFDFHTGTARAYDQSTCRAWANAILIVGGAIVVAAQPEVLAALGLVARTPAGRAFVGAGIGKLAGDVVSPAICSGLAWALDDGRGARADVPAEEPVLNVLKSEVDGEDLGVLNEGVAGNVTEGEGFTVTQVNGDANVTLTGVDGNSVTVTSDVSGNTTVTSTDSTGNVTDQVTYDSEGNQSSGGGSGDPPSTSGGYPTPDGDGGGGNGPLGPNPAAISGTLIAQPAALVQQTLAGRGSTFLMHGSGKLAGAAFGGGNRNSLFY